MDSILLFIGENIRNLNLQFDLYKAFSWEQSDQNGSLGDFIVDWDSPTSKDVVLRRKCSSGEEVAISAILGPPAFDRNGVFPREVFMKVCIKKPSLSSILHFDCQVVEESDNKSNFNVSRASYLHSLTSLGSSMYRGPPFR